MVLDNRNVNFRGKSARVFDQTYLRYIEFKNEKVKLL